MDRMKKLSETIRSLMEEEFSGYIRINFSQGSLGRVEKSEEIEDVAVVLLRDSRKEEETADKEQGVGHTIKILPRREGAQKKIQTIISIFFLLTMTSCASRAGEWIVQSGDAAVPVEVMATAPEALLISKLGMGK